MMIRSLLQPTILLLPLLATQAFLSVAPPVARNRHFAMSASPLSSAATDAAAAEATEVRREAVASKALKAALEASKKFGSTSPEARVAWDVVEEINASDNSIAYQPMADAECTVDDDTSRACQEYQAKLQELQQLLKEIPPIEKIKSLAEDIQAIKIVATQSSAPPAPDSPQLRAAMKEAKELSKKLGPDSPEARVAWTEVEDIASAGLDNALGERLDDECLVESAMTACVALEELSRVMNLQRVKDEGMADF
jgi:hypothetical protein